MSLADRDRLTSPGAVAPGQDTFPEPASDRAVSGQAPSPGAPPSPGGVAAPGVPSAEEATTGDDALEAAEKAAVTTESTGPVQAPGEPVEEPVDELALALAQRDEYLALAQRTQADFENYRKRMSREAGAAEGRGIARLVKEFLPALDNLQRALSAAAEDDPLLAGVRLVHSDLAGTLARHGVESYSPQGERFDPAEHEAMAQQPVEGAEPGTVVEVYQPGYRLNGTVLRPARVVVAA